MAKNRTEWPKEFEKRSELIKQLRQRIEELERIHVESPNYGEAVKRLVKMGKKYKDAMEVCKALLKFDPGETEYIMPIETIVDMAREVIKEEDNGKR